MRERGPSKACRSFGVVPPQPPRHTARATSSRMRQLSRWRNHNRRRLHWQHCRPWLPTNRRSRRNRSRRQHQRWRRNPYRHRRHRRCIQMDSRSRDNNRTDRHPGNTGASRATVRAKQLQAVRRRRSRMMRVCAAAWEAVCGIGWAAQSVAAVQDWLPGQSRSAGPCRTSTRGLRRSAGGSCRIRARHLRVVGLAQVRHAARVYPVADSSAESLAGRSGNPGACSRQRRSTS